MGWREGGFCTKRKYLSMCKCCQQVLSVEREVEVTREGTVCDKVTKRGQEDGI